MKRKNVEEILQLAFRKEWIEEEIPPAPSLEWFRDRLDQEEEAGLKPVPKPGVVEWVEKIVETIFVPPMAAPSMLKLSKQGALSAQTDYQSVKSLIVHTSDDGKIKATIRVTSPEMIELSFETKDPNLAEAKVAFTLIPLEGDTAELKEEVYLKATDEPNTWEGVWAGNLPHTQRRKLVFQVYR